MIRHIVMFWLKDPSEAVLRDTASRLMGMKGQIEGMRDIEVGIDFARSERSCDLCLNEVFESRDALTRYRTHPVHLPVQAHMHAVMIKSVAADYEF